MICAVLVAALCVAAPDVKSVLQKVGEDARARENSPPCTYRETTTVDELGKGDKVVGSEVRIFDVEVRGSEVIRRDLVSVKKSGEELADLLQQPKDTKGKKPARSPLHPESQGEYRFELKDGPGPDAQTLTLEPLKPSSERMRGEAVLKAGAMHELRLIPSKIPMLLKSFAMRFEFADTACGRQAIVVEIEGEGIAVFVGTKFRSRSLLEGHARVVPPKVPPKKK